MGTTVGVVAVALSSALMLAAGPRILGTHAFSGLAIAWTATAVFGFGLAAPTEQLVIRRLNAGAPHAVRPPMTVLAALAALAIVASVVLGLTSTTRHSFHPLIPTMVVGVGGWYVLTFVRARLAGAGDLTSYARVLWAESVTRVQRGMASRRRRRGTAVRRCRLRLDHAAPAAGAGRRARRLADA